jgi:hypothetical protein
MILNDPGLTFGVNTLLLEPSNIFWNTQDSMRMASTQVGRHQIFGQKTRILRRQAASSKDPRDQPL